MQLRIEETSTWEVKYASHTRSGWVFDVSKGVWWLDLPSIVEFVNERIGPYSFGGSVDCFIFGFELITFSDSPRETKDYVSFRPKMNAIISVGQLDWPSVKHLRSTEQFAKFCQVLFESVSRIGVMKRKPRDFDYRRLLGVLSEVLSLCDGSEFSVPLEFERLKQ